MKRALHRAVVVAAGGAGMVLLDAVSKSRGGRSNITQTLLWIMRPAPVRDDTVEARVRNRLARTATDPDAITVSIEHGCVDLRGVVPTRERPRIVRAIATVTGVDSVLDLMTEPPSANAPLTSAGRRAPALTRRAGRPQRRANGWTRSARALAVGGGLGLTIAGLRVGRLKAHVTRAPQRPAGLLALAAVTVGLLLIARGATVTSRRVA